MNIENHRNGNVGAYIGGVSLLVRDYDEAIAFYVEKAGFQLLEDTVINTHKRWVRVAPPGGGCALLLAKAGNPEQQAAVGNQAGGRVWLFLMVTEFWNIYQSMTDAGVEFLEEPRKEPYGHVCVFEDLYGNRWDLLESGIPS